MSEAEVKDAPQQEAEAQEEEYVMPESFAAKDDGSIADYSQDPGGDDVVAPPEEVQAEAEAEAEAEVEAEAETVEAVGDEPEEDIVAKISEFRAKAKEERSRLKETKELDTYKTKISRFEELERLKRDDPLKFIKESGLNFEDIAEQALTMRQEPTADHKLTLQDHRLLELEDQNKSLAARLDERDQQYQRNYFIGQIKDFVDTNNKYDLIKQTDSYNSVLREAEEFYSDTGQQLEVADACKLVTKNLRDIAKKFYSSEALANEFGYEKRQMDDSPQQPKGNGKVIAEAPKTLTNSMTAQPSVEKEEDVLKIDKRERISRAASLLEFTE
jgi:hypothetical protein